MKRLLSLTALLLMAVAEIWASYTPTADELIILNDIYNANAERYSTHEAIAFGGIASPNSKRAGDPYNDGLLTTVEMPCYSVKGNGKGKDITVSVTGISGILVYHEKHSSRYIQFLTAKNGSVISEGLAGTTISAVNLDPSKEYSIFLHGTATGSDSQDFNVYAIKLVVGPMAPYSFGPIINLQPTDITYDVGSVDNPNLNLIATSSDDKLSYQWQYSTDSKNFSAISDAIAPSAVTASLLSSDIAKVVDFTTSAIYYVNCVISDAHGSVTTRTVSLNRSLASLTYFEVGGIYYKITSSTSPLTVNVTFSGDTYDSYDNEYAGSVNIPQTVAYYGFTFNVTGIGSEAFRNCSNLTSVTIPTSVATIGKSAFSSCTSLKSVSYGALDFNDYFNPEYSYRFEPKGTNSKVEKGICICEIDNGTIWSVMFPKPYIFTTSSVYGDNFTTFYDYDADGTLESFGWTETTYTGNKDIYHYGFYNKVGNKEIELFDQNSYGYYATPINGNGDLFYHSSENYHMYDSKTQVRIFDVDNDGRKDLVGPCSSSDDSFTIYYQQADGTFKAIEQTSTKDEAAVLAEKNKKGTGGIVSFAVGMMVGGGSSYTSNNFDVALDMNDDGIMDFMSSSSGGVLYSYDDNKYWANPKKGVLYPCDLNNDGEFDYICYDGSNIILLKRTGGGTYDETTLFANSNVKQIIYKDFDHDGDIDILAYISDTYTTSSTGNTYFVFFRNDGDMSFKRRERNFAVNYDLLDIKDVDADGLYEMSVYDYTNKIQKLLRINTDLTVTEDAIDMSDRVLKCSYAECPIAIGDFDNDGKVDYRYSVSGRNNFKGSKYGRFSDVVNSAPDKMEKPTAVLDAEAQRLRINWKQGTDKETSSCDLTYELRIGTEPASGNVLFGASLADGTRRTLEEGNMGRSLSTLFNAKSLKPGKYYISVQAVDAGGRGGAWSDDFVYEHQLAAPVIVSNFTQRMSTADTIRLSVKAPIDGAEYKWTVSEGRQIESDGFDTRFVFEHDGEHTVNLAMTYDGRTLNAETLMIDVAPLTSNYTSRGYVDFNQDGYPEYLGYVNDGNGNIEKVLLSYVTDIPSGSKDYLDYNFDGYPDAVVSNRVYVNLGEQDNDFDYTTETFKAVKGGYTYSEFPFGGYCFDANNDGYMDKTSTNSNSYYNDGTYNNWRSFDNIVGSYSRYLMYDVNRDGFTDIVKKYGGLYVMYKDSTANIAYSEPQLLCESVGSDWNIEDLNNDGYADIVSYSGSTLTVVKGSETLPYTETATYDLPGNINYISSIRDYNNDGYMDVQVQYEKDGSYTYALAEFGSDFSMKLVELDSKPEGYYFMVQKDGGYPDGNLSHITNQSPSAPATVTAKQTRDGMLITWSDAEDDHTPAMQMRYNISVKRKGKKGDNSFVISPMNGLIDKATICGTVMYKKSTQMLVPASVLTAGETYEIQVQAIDLWNQHSPMTKAVEFTMTSNGYIDVCEQVATDKETTVKFVGTQAGSYSLNAGDGATIVSDMGNGEYTVKWATEGVKDIMLTAGDATVKSSVTVVKPIDLAFTVPASVFAKAPLTIEVSDEMAKAAKNVGLRCSDSKVKIDYVIGSKTADVTFPQTGTYTLEAYSTDEVKGNTYSQVVKVTADMPKAIISQVDVDAATGSYAINWDAMPADISKVIICKEGSRLGQFNEIGTVNVASGRYVDLSSNASVMASRYCIRLIADNGQKSAESVAHKPLHVMIAKAVKGYNLIWNGYEGLNVESYGIMRGSTPENMQMIEQVAGSVNSYTDISAPAGVSYYAVTFEAQKDAPHQNSLNTVTETGTEDAVSSNIISTEDAVDIVEAQSLELIVLDEDATLNDGHKELQLYYMILPTYATISKVKWEITEGSDIATIDANGVLHATGGDGTVKVRVATLDGSDLSAEISVPCSVFIDEGPTSVRIEDASSETTLKEKRYFTIDGKQVTAPVSGQPYVEWSIYSNGQIVSRKVMKR